MSTQRHLLAVFGAAAGGLVAAAMVPLAVAYADDNCALGECTLVSGGNPTDVTYSGFRPLVTYWTSNQPVNVEVTPRGARLLSPEATMSRSRTTSLRS
jgi:hypothetical protein